MDQYYFALEGARWSSPGSHPDNSQSGTDSSASSSVASTESTGVVRESVASAEGHGSVSGMIPSAGHGSVHGRNVNPPARVMPPESQTGRFIMHNTVQFREPGIYNVTINLGGGAGCIPRMGGHPHGIGSSGISRGTSSAAGNSNVGRWGSGFTCAHPGCTSVRPSTALRRGGPRQGQFRSPDEEWLPIEEDSQNPGSRTLGGNAMSVSRHQSQFRRDT